MHGRYGCTQACNQLVGRYPGWWNNLHRLPKCANALSGRDGSGNLATRPLTVAGAAQVRSAVTSPALLLPVELRPVNQAASTNARILQPNRVAPYNAEPMSNTSQIDQITERVERLLVRYDELQRTNALLSAQVQSLVQERDSLKSRLGAARSRVDALLERLPDAMGISGQKGNP